MNTDAMTPADILRHAVRIENESREFYLKASQTVEAPKTRALAADLMNDEVAHARHLQKLLDRTVAENPGPVESADLRNRMLIEIPPVPGTATETDVLNTALRREESTRDFYGMLLTLTDLAADLNALFGDLYEQESGHVKKIRKRLKAL